MVVNAAALIGFFLTNFDITFAILSCTFWGMKRVANYANDNDELSFITLAAATANVTRYLVPRRGQEEQRDKDGRPEDSEKKSPSKEREYIEHRLRELAAWERKISGKR